jgi:Tfp pilus assembly protein PilE
MGEIEQMKKSKGISLIVLVITIIVIIILAGAIILEMSDNNPIDQAKEAKFKSNVDSYKAELTLAISKEYLQNENFDKTEFDATIWDGSENIDGTVKQYITSITETDGLKFEIQDAKLVYVGEKDDEKLWFVGDVGEPTEEITVSDFDFTGDVQSLVVPSTGSYKLEVWGAQGGNSTHGSTSSGGKGGYAVGTVNLTAGDTIYVYVGGQGEESVDTNLVTGGWNGGGGNWSAGGGATGGGATDIRINGQELTNRIIVAGGGSGAAWDGINGAAGGGLTGVNGTSWDGYASGLGGTQTAGGSYSGTTSGGGQKQSITEGTLGIGGRGSGSSNGGSGGGGGYYGGGGGLISSGGGGSSYVEGLTDASTIAGNASFTAPDGNAETGHPGNGYARITKL